MKVEVNTAVEEASLFEDIYFSNTIRSDNAIYGWGILDDGTKSIADEPNDV